MPKFQSRCIVSGKHVEYYVYGKPIYFSMNTNKSFPKPPVKKSRYVSSLSQPSLFTPLRSDSSVRRSKQRLRRIINSNPDLNKFITLTFADNVKSVSYANKQFTLFVKRLKYRFPNLKYVSVLEFQSRGAIHYHLLCNLGYLDSEILAKIWGQGFIRINKLKNHDNVGAYLTAYLKKDFQDVRLYNKKKYFYSRNLAMPVLIGKSDWWTKRYYDEKLANLKPTFDSYFPSDRLDYVHIQHFVL